MSGISRMTGRALDANSIEHLVQSIGDILTTPIGSRVLRRTYGSELPDLIDQPLNPRTRMRIFAATAMALLRWEPRIRLKRVSLRAGADGVAALDLVAVRTDLPRRPTVNFFIPLQA
tara:strand:- start:8854 stop:9204 length:351 start_codon:yes stop_codon:yes gene_type:complete